MNGESQYNPRDSVPVPDPTKLTTEQLFREMAHQEQLFNAQVSSAKEFADQRYKLARESIDGKLEDFANLMNERFIALQRAVDKAEEATTKQLDSLTMLVETKDHAREAQIRDVEKRVDRDEGKSQGITQSGAAVAVIVTIAISIVALIAANFLTG